MAETILSNWIFKDILLPFLLIFFIVFAILEKTKLFGEDKKRINALIAFVISLIFVGAFSYTNVINNLTLFLTITIVCVFVILLIWGFIFGDKEGFKPTKWMTWILGITAGIAFAWAVIWANGWTNTVSGIFSGNSVLGQTIITNGIFLLVIGVALALVLMKPKG